MGTGVVSLAKGSVIDEFLPQFVRPRNKYNMKRQWQKRNKGGRVTAEREVTIEARRKDLERENIPVLPKRKLGSKSFETQDRRSREAVRDLPLHLRDEAEPVCCENCEAGRLDVSSRVDQLRIDRSVVKQLPQQRFPRSQSS